MSGPDPSFGRMQASFPAHGGQTSQDQAALFLRMKEKQEAAELAFTISPHAVALLEFTTYEAPGKRSSSALSYLVSKDAYAWAAAAMYIGHQAGMSGLLITDLRLTQEVLSIVGRHEEIIRLAYREPITFRALGKQGRASGLGNRESVSAVPALTVVDPKTDVCALVLEDLLRAFTSNKWNAGTTIEYLNDVIRNGTKELAAYELTTDPILEAGTALAILPFVPFSVTRLTKKGRLVHFELQAALWRYERGSDSPGQVSSKLHLDVARIARCLKRGLIAAFHEATKSSDEPPEEPPEE